MPASKARFNPASRLQPNLNTGKTWSEADISDLRWCAAHGEDATETAWFLCRNRPEVIEKARELGIKLHWFRKERRAAIAERDRKRRQAERASAASAGSTRHPRVHK
jgi:hypothetical protein